MVYPRKTRWIAALVALLLSGAIVFTFGHSFGQMWMRWFPAWDQSRLSLYDRIVEGEGYYTHGPLVPLVSLTIILLLIRHTRIVAVPRPLMGGIVLAGALLLHLGATFARVAFASEIAFVAVLIGLVLMLWGTSALRRLWFPLVFLLFMVPLPEVTIASLNFRLKMLAADWGVQLASLLGVPVERVGPRVVLAGGKSLIVANVCNGLRTLISLMAFGTLYAYVCQLRGGWRLALLGATIPIAVLINAIRIASLVIVAEVWNEKAATGWWHDTSGVLIFILAFLLMFALERLILLSRAWAKRPAPIGTLFDGQLRPSGEASPWPRMASLWGTNVAWSAVVAVGLAGAATAWLSRPVGSVSSEAALMRALPETLTIQNQPWTGSLLQLTPRELTILENPAYVYRRYRQSGRGDYMDYCFLFGRENRKGIHPPDLCVEGFGQGIIQKGDLLVSEVPGQGTVLCSELVIQSGSSTLYMLYTYKFGKAYTNSFWRQQWSICANNLLGREASGGLVRISTVVKSSLPETRAMATEFLRQTIPRLDAELSGRGRPWASADKQMNADTMTLDSTR